MNPQELYNFVEKAIFHRQVNNAYELATMIKRKTGQRIDIHRVRALINQVATSYRNEKA